MGEGETHEKALAAGKSAIAFHLETFGPDMILLVLVKPLL